MYYVIRDDYSEYEFTIVAAAPTVEWANKLMLKDIRGFVKKNELDIIVPDNNKLDDKYEEAKESGLDVWLDGALIEETCRWGVSYWKGEPRAKILGKGKRSGWVSGMDWYVGQTMPVENIETDEDGNINVTIGGYVFAEDEVEFV